MRRQFGRGPRLAAMAGVLAALTLAACGDSDNDSDTASTPASTAAATQAAEAPAVKDAKLTIGMNSPTYSTQMVTFVAKDKGFFAEEGITDVEVITSDDYVAGMLGGSIDITQGDTDTLLAAAAKSPEPIVLIANYRYKEFQMLAVGKEIEEAADLKGKTVTGGDRGGRNEAVVKELLTELGVDPKDVKFVPLGGGSDDRLQALLAGKVDATNLFPRHTNPLQEGGGKFLAQELKDVPQESVATTAKFLEENRPLVDAYLRATLKARQFIADEANWPEVLQIMKDNDFEVTPDFEAVFDQEVVQVSPDGGFSPAGMDDFIKVEQDLELLPADVEWRKHFDLDALWQAQEALGLEQNPKPDEVQAP